MKLYGSLTSPYVRKVRVLLKEKGIACEFAVENPYDEHTRVPALNPLGKIPVLELDNKNILYDSTLIVEYLDSLKAPALIPASGDARWAVLRWHILAQGVLDAVVTRLFETRRPPEQQSREVIKRQEQKIARALAAAEGELKGAHAVGTQLTLADLAFALALEYIDFRYPHDWRTPHPRLAGWLLPYSGRDSFIDTLPPGMEKPRPSAR